MEVKAADASSGVQPVVPDSNGLSQLVSRSLEVMACYGRDRRYRAVSPALAEVLGYSASALLDQTNAGLADLAEHSDEPVAIQSYWRQVDDVIATVLRQGEAERRIHPFPTAAGVQIYDTTYTPIKNADGQVIQILSISREALPEVKMRSQLVARSAAAPPSQAIVSAEMPDLEVPSLSRVSVTLEQTAWGRTEPAESEQRVSAEAESIHQTAEFLQLVLDNILQHIFWKDRNSVYLGCNRRWAEMTGIGDPSNVVGLTDNDLPWTRAQRDWYLECDRRVMETDTPMLRIKQSQREADGRISWRETSKLPLHDAEGNVIGLLGTIEDVTERKIAEDLLNQSRETFQKLAKQKGLLNQISAQIRKSLKPEVIQKTMVHEIRQLLNADRVVIYRFEADWRGLVVVESVVQPWCSTLGNIGADDCFAEEYAELYRQGRVEAIPDVEAADIEACHKDFLRQLGVRANLIVPILDQRKLWGLLITHQCSGPRQWKESEIELLQALAGQFGVAIQQAELHTQTKRSAALAEERAQQLEVALQELKQAQSQLIQTEKMSVLGKMVAGIAHEINNPVTFIHGNITHLKGYCRGLVQLVELYQQHYPTPPVAIAQRIEAIELDYLLEDLGKVLQSIEIGSIRIHQIVTSLRTFSRLDEAEKKAIDIHAGLDSTLLILQHHIRAQPNRAEIQIFKEYGDLPLVECYPSQLNQVFMNLISNALDALDQQIADSGRADIDEAPYIKIATQVRDNKAVITICDNGPGVAAEDQHRLFEPFFTTKPAGKGTGLGLSISHQIVVNKHGGQLRHTSEGVKGSQFEVVIPLRQR
ncbi:MAG: GAF domain-containing protein [Elainellaceae cyanobacterium]